MLGLMNIDKEELAHKLQEYAKCSKDPIYFIENYVKNYHFDNEPIKLREKQKEIINALLNDHRVIINGSRQTGKTTVINLYILWLVTFFKNYTVFIMSKKGDSTAELVKEVYEFYRTVPDWLKPSIVTDNVYTKEFSNGSRVKGVTVPKGKEAEAGRGMRGGFIFLDEVAFFDSDIEKIYTGLVPTTSFIFEKYKERNYPYGMVLVSTPNGTFGQGKFFFEMWTAALKGEVNFKPIRYHWSDVPEYANDPNWIEEKRKEFKDIRQFNQEYELVFLGSTYAFFPDDVIEKLQLSHHEPIKKVYLKHASIDLYEQIDPDRFYLIGIDTATGYASDYSAIIITDYETGLPIAEYRHRLPLEDFKEDILDIPKKLGLKNFLYIPENNGVGSSISQWLPTTEYGSKHVYHSKKKSGKTFKRIPGLSTDRVTRPLMLESLYEIVSSNAELIKPTMLKTELIALEKRGNRVEAPPGLHDDTVFAYAFTTYVREYGDLKTIALNKKDIHIKMAKSIIAVHELYNMKRGVSNESINNNIHNSFFTGF